MNEQTTNAGTEIKIAVALDCGGVSMDNMRFFVDFFTNPKHKVRVGKEQMRRESAKQYVAVVDTSGMATGVVRMRVEADIPDSDCDDGYRKEIVTTSTDIFISR